jgi:hypothetical protein
MLVLFYGHSVGLVFFSNGISMESIQFSCVRSLRKIFIFILFINVPKFVKTFCQYGNCLFQIVILSVHEIIIKVMCGNFLFNCHGCMKFLSTFGGTSDKYEKKIAPMYLRL